jgi:hypothetical protein
MSVQPKDSKSFDEVLEQMKKDRYITKKIKLVNKK